MYTQMQAHIVITYIAQHPLKASSREQANTRVTQANNKAFQASTLGFPIPQYFQPTVPQFHDSSFPFFPDSLIMSFPWDAFLLFLFFHLNFFSLGWILSCQLYSSLFPSHHLIREKITNWSRLNQQEEYGMTIPTFIVRGTCSFHLISRHKKRRKQAIP